MPTVAAAQQGAPRSALRRLIARHPVAAFLAMAYTITSAFYLPAVRALLDIDILGLDLALWDSFGTIFGVALPAFLVIAAAEGRAGVRDLARRSLRWRVGPQWYFVALLALPLGVVLCASALFGLAPLQALVDKWRLLFTLVVPMLLIRIGLFNLPEEIGFMGFLQDRLQEQRGPLKGSLLTTIAFALWHLPSWMHEFEFTLAQLHLALAVTVLFGITHLFARVFLMWLYNSTNRSVLLVGLFHSAFNTTVSPHGFGGEFIPAASAFWIAMVLLAVAAVLVAVVTRGRLGYKESTTALQLDASPSPGPIPA
jgi:membrane protease YdiL (CAAX protease family)